MIDLRDLDSIDLSSLARRETGRLDDRKRLMLWTQLLMDVPLLDIVTTEWASKRDLRRYIRSCHRIAKAWREASDKVITAGAIPAAERIASWRWCDVADRADRLKEMGR